MCFTSFNDRSKLAGNPSGCLPSRLSNDASFQDAKDAVVLVPKACCKITILLHLSVSCLNFSPIPELP